MAGSVSSTCVRCVFISLERPWLASASAGAASNEPRKGAEPQLPWTQAESNVSNQTVRLCQTHRRGGLSAVGAQGPACLDPGLPRGSFLEQLPLSSRHGGVKSTGLATRSPWDGHTHPDIGVVIREAGVRAAIFRTLPGRTTECDLGTGTEVRPNALCLRWL